MTGATEEQQKCIHSRCETVNSCLLFGCLFLRLEKAEKEIRDDQRAQQAKRQQQAKRRRP